MITGARRTPAKDRHFVQPMLEANTFPVSNGDLVGGRVAKIFTIRENV